MQRKGRDLSRTCARGVYDVDEDLMQVAGGWMGDRALAPRAMVLFGAAAIMTGHVTLSLIPGFLDSWQGSPSSRSAPARSRRISRR